VNRGIATHQEHLSLLLDEAASSDPAATALVFGDTAWSFDELRRRVRSAASALREHDADARTLVGVSMPNSPNLVAALLAVWELDAVAVDVNPALPGAERDAVLERAGVAAIVDEGSFANGSLTTVRRLERRAGPADAAAPPSDLACVNLTSGSTGSPKGVMLPHSNLLRNAELYVRCFGLTERDRTCLALPLFFGMNKIALLAHLMVGATVVLEPNFLVPDRALAAMEANACTGWCAVPASVHALLARADVARRPVPSMRYVRIGAGHLDVGVAYALRRPFPAAEVFLTYGLTEVGLVTVLSREELASRPRSCGRPVDGVQVELVDDSEVAVRCGHAALGYWRDPEETESVFRDGTVRTGDVGTTDADGYLHLTGRKKELIKSGGENISPAEVEAALARHPGVLECAVVGVPDDWLGEAIVAFVVPIGGRAPDEADLRRHAVRALPPIKRPQRYVIASELPRSETGKVKRAELVARGGDAGWLA
jgi:acyl-CoA synthetase (AMP-forming)/AMP-acid ligase II